VGTHLIWLGDEQNGYYISPHKNLMLSVKNGVGRLVGIDINISQIDPIKDAAYVTLLADGDLEPFKVNQSLNPYWSNLHVAFDVYYHDSGKFWATNDQYVGFKNPSITNDLWVFCEPSVVRRREKANKDYRLIEHKTYSLNPINF
jgi:hypothetical protein